MQIQIRRIFNKYAINNNHKLSHPHIITLMTTNINIPQFVNDVPNNTSLIEIKTPPKSRVIFISESDDEPINKGVMKELTSSDNFYLSPWNGYPSIKGSTFRLSEDVLIKYAGKTE
jgi:hypothetical protein